MLSTTAAVGGVSTDDLVRHGMPPGLADFAANVSRHEGNWDSQNDFNCVGAFQFCPGTLGHYYGGTREEFLADPSAQVNAWLHYQSDQWEAAERLGMTDLIGQEVCYEGNCSTITASSILMACQFGCLSLDGKLGYYQRTGDCQGDGATDGYNASVCILLVNGAGYEVSDLTGMTEEDLERLGIDRERDAETAFPAMVLMPWQPRSPRRPVMMHGSLESLR